MTSYKIIDGYGELPSISIIVYGSKRDRSYNRLADELDALRTIYSINRLVHRGSLTGTDTHAEKYAQRHNIDQVVFLIHNDLLSYIEYELPDRSMMIMIQDSMINMSKDSKSIIKTCIDNSITISYID